MLNIFIFIYKEKYKWKLRQTLSTWIQIKGSFGCSFRTWDNLLLQSLTCLLRNGISNFLEPENGGHFQSIKVCHSNYSTSMFQSWKLFQSVNPLILRLSSIFDDTLYSQEFLQGLLTYQFYFMEQDSVIWNTAFLSMATSLEWVYITLEDYPIYWGYLIQ